MHSLDSWEAICTAWARGVRYAHPGLVGHSMHSVCEPVITRAEGREDKVGFTLR